MPVASAALVTPQDHGLMDETPDPALLSRRGGFSSHGEDAAIMAVLVAGYIYRVWTHRDIEPDDVVSPEPNPEDRDRDFTSL